MRVILSTLASVSLLSSIISAQIIGTGTAVSTVINANGTSPEQTSIPLLNILQGPSNSSYTPHTYLGRVLAVSAENTIYAISCLVNYNATACGSTPVTVTQGPSTFVRVDAMTTLATQSFNLSGVARPTGTAPVTAAAKVQTAIGGESALSCSLSPDSAVCVNAMVLPPEPTAASALKILPRANFENKTELLTSTYAKSDIVWDVLIITEGIELVKAAATSTSGSSDGGEGAGKTPIGPTSVPDPVLAGSSNGKQTSLFESLAVKQPLNLKLSASIAALAVLLALMG